MFIQYKKGGLTQEHKIVASAGTQTSTFQSGVKQINRKATMFPQHNPGVHIPAVIFNPLIPESD